MPNIHELAEIIARSIVEQFSAPYFALEPTQHQKRERVIAEAAKVVERILKEQKIS